MQDFTMGRVLEGQISGVQVQWFTWSALSVKPITHNRTAESQAMGGMDPELMGPAGFGSEQNPAAMVFNADFAPAGYTEFPMHRIMDLVGSVVHIQTERQPDLPLMVFNDTLQHGHILFLHLTIPELARKILMRQNGQGQHHQAGGVHIQAVHGRLRDAVRNSPFQPVDDTILLVRAFAGHGQESGRFVDYHQKGVLVDDWKLMGTRFHLFPPGRIT